MRVRMRNFAGGAAIGAANGLFGGGGGMLAVPLLERELAARQAHATAIAVILPISAAGGVIYAACGLVPLSVLLPVALGVTAGGTLGARLLPVLPERAVEFLFALLMLAAGIRMAL